jgi:hypothetical protein
MKAIILQSVEFQLMGEEKFIHDDILVSKVAVTISPPDPLEGDTSDEPYVDVKLQGWQVTKTGKLKKNGRWASAWGGIDTDDHWTKLANEHLEKNK